MYLGKRSKYQGNTADLVRVEGHYRRRPNGRQWAGNTYQADPELIEFNKRIAQERRADEYRREYGSTYQGNLGQGLPPGGAIPASVAKLNMLEGRLNAGRISLDQYETEKSKILFEEGLTPQQAEEKVQDWNTKHPQDSPLFKIGLLGFGSGAILSAVGLFLLYKMID